jgi:2-hydroxyacyl-CoA lyase 1
MEMETMCRYKLPIIIVVFNNGGIYGGDRREDGLRGRAARGLEKAGWPDDPAPTAFVPGARYDLLATAFRGDGYDVSTASDLTAALEAALASGQPSLINVAIDPKAGVESGTVHSFNFVKK